MRYDCSYTTHLLLLLMLGTLPSWSYKAVIRTIKLTPSPLAWPPWWYRSEISLYMPDFLCLTVLLLACNGVIVCSRYGATKSVTARIDTVIKQDWLWAVAPWFTCHAGTIYLFPCSFHQRIITIHFELFHAKKKKKGSTTVRWCWSFIPFIHL